MSSSAITNTETVKYGLSISVQKPIVDWSKARDASLTISNEGSVVETSIPGSDTHVLRIGGNQVSRVSIVAQAKETCTSDIHIVVEPLAHTTIVIQTNSYQESNYKQKITLDADIESNISLVLIQTLNKESRGFFDVTINTQQDANVSVLSLDVSGNFIQRSIIAHLLGEGASCNQQVVSLCDKKQHDLYTESNHVAPRTKSDILTRAALLNQSKSISRSLIRIGQNAPGSEGYEKQEALVLSRDSEADAIPNLEIHNHDVKCSHGSTIGQLDEEKLYYLMSRGLNRQQAVHCMIEGYFMPVIKSIPDQATCILVHDCVQRLFNQASERHD